MISLYALKDTIESGDQYYPIYVALLKAKDIFRIAQVPSYRDSTRNAEIAQNVSDVPVKEWQRPRISDKVERIRQLFNNKGEFMPNPVLLGENIHANARPVLTVTPHLVAGNVTPAYEIQIDDPPSDGEKPALDSRRSASHRGPVRIRAVLQPRPRCPSAESSVVLLRSRDIG